MSIEPFAVPTEMIRDLMLPLQRPQVRGFADALVLSALVQRLEQTLSVKVAFPGDYPGPRMELRFANRNAQ